MPNDYIDDELMSKFFGILKYFRRDGRSPIFNAPIIFSFFRYIPVEFFMPLDGFLLHDCSCEGREGRRERREEESAGDLKI